MVGKLLHYFEVVAKTKIVSQFPPISPSITFGRRLSTTPATRALLFQPADSFLVSFDVRFVDGDIADYRGKGALRFPIAQSKNEGE